MADSCQETSHNQWADTSYFQSSLYAEYKILNFNNLYHTVNTFQRILPLQNYTFQRFLPSPLQSPIRPLLCLLKTTLNNIAQPKL